MVENQKKLGLVNLYSIVNFQLICTHFVLSDIVFSGVETSIVLIMRLILLDQKQMMEKFDFIHLNVLGLIVVCKKSGTIFGENKIQILKKYIRGGIQ